MIQTFATILLKSSYTQRTFSRYIRKKPMNLKSTLNAFLKLQPNTNVLVSLALECFYKKQSWTEIGRRNNVKSNSSDIPPDWDCRNIRTSHYDVVASNMSFMHRGENTPLPMHQKYTSSHSFLVGMTWRSKSYWIITIPSLNCLTVIPFFTLAIFGQRCELTSAKQKHRIYSILRR